MTTAPVITNRPISNKRAASGARSLVIFWTPRAVVAGLAGYSCLGIAYEWEIMAAIDRIAIRYLKQFGGYAGIGAFMPLFQWYSAWAVRITAGLLAGIAYDVAARIAIRVCQFTRASFSTDRSRSGAPPCPA